MTIDFWMQVAEVMLALFIITDSVGNLPFFMGMTEGSSPEERRNVFNTALITGLVLLLVFGFAGSLILRLFGLTMEDLKIAGGILLLFISTEVLIRGKMTYEHKEDVGVVPLGCPLLVGPGAITTMLMFLKVYNIYAVFTGLAICFVLIWLVLFFSEFIYRIVGRNGALIITKIAAIIMASLAVKFIRDGIQVLFHL